MSIGFSIFPVFVNSFIKGLPKCRVAHSIRQSYLYNKDNNHEVYHNISYKYHIPYYYIQKGLGLDAQANSFYYFKNNLISYYVHPMQNNKFRLIPLYNHVKNNHEFILSDTPYDSHDLTGYRKVCVVKAPNRQLYLINTGATPLLVENASKSTIVYGFSKDATYLFHSMPIANSFFIFVMRNHKNIVIHIIDLIRERKYVQKYSIEKIIEILTNVSKENDRYYEELKSIKNSEKLYLKIFNNLYDVKNTIDKTVSNLVFYDSCIVNISLFFGLPDDPNSKMLRNALSILAIYKNNELTVSLQINSRVKVGNIHRQDNEIDFGSSIVLISNKYEFDNKYDISQSHLYPVRFSMGDYTIINEINLSPDIFALYYKNKPNIIFERKDFDIYNLNDVLFFRVSDKKIIFVNKDKLEALNKVDKYYIESGTSNNNDLHIDIIETKPIQDLLLNSTHKSNDTKWVGTEVTNIVKSVKLNGRFEKIIRRHFCFRNRFELFKYTHYIDYDSKEFYLLAYFECSEYEFRYYFGRHKICLFKVKINNLFSDRMNFELVLEFEADVFNEDLPIIFNSLDSIFNNLKTVTSNGYNISLRLFFKKLITRHKLIGLKVLRMYDRKKAYYDYEFNRRSVTTTPIDTSIISILHLVRRILPALRTI